MNYAIPQKVLDETTECEHGYLCLSKESPCVIILKVATNVREIFCAMTKPCPYCKKISPTEGICTCPVRIELFRKHGV